MTATYNYHIGVDYHKSYSHLVVQDSAGKTLRSGRVKNDRQSLGSFLELYRESSHAVMEATRNWMVMYDWLDDICDDVVLAHPLKVKAIADAKIKTDKIDATVLAHLLRADLVPEAWAPTEKARGLRVALRERMFYVRLRTMVKNRVRSFLLLRLGLHLCARDEVEVTSQRRARIERRSVGAEHYNCQRARTPEPRAQASSSNYKSAASKTAATQSRKTRTRGDS